MESDSDSGNEHNKASSIPSQASKVSEEISDRTLSKHHLEKQKIISADCHEEDSPDTKPPTSLKNIPTKRALKKGTQEEENPVRFIFTFFMCLNCVKGPSKFYCRISFAPRSFQAVLSIRHPRKLLQA